MAKGGDFFRTNVLVVDGVRTICMDAGSNNWNEKRELTAWNESTGKNEKDKLNFRHRKM